jgi:iron complex outermembrane receptor protein
VACLASATHPGGVIQLQRDYAGLDVRWRGQVLPSLSLVAGLAADGLTEQRRGLQNFSGGALGVEGVLRRDESNRVNSLDPYLQASWQVAPRWQATAGVRHSTGKFQSTDHYLASGNPDDSGSARYSATLPVLGLLFSPNAQWRLYANAGRGFETPTLNELAYRPTGATGLNLALAAATSNNLELGAKARLGSGEWRAALFQTQTAQEIVTQTNLGGRATYQNAGRTRRRGLELSWESRWAGPWKAQLAYTLLDAAYRDGFLQCSSVPCAQPTQAIPAGRQIPGLARHAAYAALDWTDASGWRAGLALRGLSRVQVNDLNSDAAAAYVVADAKIGYKLQLRRLSLDSSLRIDNLFDRSHIGSVIVNEGNGRYFEPAPGRRGWIGLNAQYAF